MDHLVVGKYQDELLALGIEHAEGQLPVVVMAEIWIALHVIQEIVHPAHVPLEVESSPPSFSSPETFGQAVDSSAIRTEPFVSLA